MIPFAVPLDSSLSLGEFLIQDEKKQTTKMEPPNDQMGKPKREETSILAYSLIVPQKHVSADIIKLNQKAPFENFKTERCFEPVSQNFSILRNWGVRVPTRSAGTH